MQSPMPQNRYQVVAPVNSNTEPATHFELMAVAALGGVLLGLAGKSGRASTATRMAGLALLGVAARPLIAAAMRSAGARRRTVAITSSIEIARPVPEVFAFFKDFENFPRVVGSVRSVLDYQDGRSHWEVYTPSGGVVAWDAVVNKYVPNSVIAWESVVRSLVYNSGIVRFTALSPTRTRVDVTITHHPLQTSLKDAARALLAPRAANLVGEQLDRIRFYLESLPAATEPEASTDSTR
jgi:uncharacterized membrane protein